MKVFNRSSILINFRMAADFLHEVFDKSVGLIYTTYSSNFEHAQKRTDLTYRAEIWNITALYSLVTWIQWRSK